MCLLIFTLHSHLHHKALLHLYQLLLVFPYNKIFIQNCLKNCDRSKTWVTNQITQNKCRVNLSYNSSLKDRVRDIISWNYFGHLLPRNSNTATLKRRRNVTKTSIKTMPKPVSTIDFCVRLRSQTNRNFYENKFYSFSRHFMKNLQVLK